MSMSIYIRIPDRKDNLYYVYSLPNNPDMRWETNSEEEMEAKMQELDKVYGMDYLYPVINLNYDNKLLLDGNAECRPIITSVEEPVMQENDRWYKVLRVDKG